MLRDARIEIVGLAGGGREPKGIRPEAAALGNLGTIGAVIARL